MVLMMYKLLIAEDEELERIALKKIIESNFSNINVINSAKNGEEAVNLARTYMPDILLIDIRMPVKNGIEAHKQIIKFHPTIKTIIITAHSEFVYAQEAIKYNVYDFLLKPVSPTVICNCIQSIISSSEKLSIFFLKYSFAKYSLYFSSFVYCDISGSFPLLIVKAIFTQSSFVVTLKFI